MRPTPVNTFTLAGGEISLRPPYETFDYKVINYIVNQQLDKDSGENIEVFHYGLIRIYAKPICPSLALRSDTARNANGCCEPPM